jgi:hypothetical protein
VYDLMVDMNSMKVRYMSVTVERNLFDDDRRILIPIGAAELDTKDDHVLIPSFERNSLNNYPTYNGEPITREYEHTLMTGMSPQYNKSSYREDEFYNHEYFDDSRFYGSRRSQRGGTAYLKD